METKITMQASELRVNSYYKINKSVSIDENVFKLDLTEIRANKNICDFIDPIPLTEEWLLKFEKVGWINTDILGIFYWFNGEKKYIPFVHSLQNTYFCIEQKELILCKG